MLRVEFNPSRFAEPEGVTLVEPRMVSLWLWHLLRGLQDACTPTFSLQDEPKFDPGRSMASWLSEVNLTRVDVAADVQVADPEAVLAACRVTTPKWAREVFSAYTAGQGLTSVFTKQSKANGKIILYDKHLQSGGMVPPGTLRFEAQTRTQRLKKYHLNRLDLLSNDRAFHMLSEQWERSRWSLESAPPNPLAVIAQSDLSPNRKASLVGYLMLKAGGHETGLSATTRRALETKARRFGIQPGTPM